MTFDPINWEIVSVYNIAIIVLMIALIGLFIAWLFPGLASLEQEQQ